MSRFINKFAWGLQQVTGKLSECFFYETKLFYRYSSQKCKGKPVKLSYKLFQPKYGSDDFLSPLIFLHGLLQSKEVTWANLPQAVADQTKRKAYSLDLRNHGDSEWNDETDIDMFTIDLLNFLDVMNIQKAVIIGHSCGGMNGIKVALKSPGRIEMLFVEEMFVKKMPQLFFDEAHKYLTIWREAVEIIPPEMEEESVDNFIKKYVLQKMHPQSYISDSCISRYPYLSHPLRKESSGRYVFKLNLPVLTEQAKSAETSMVENEGIYEGPSFFLYGTKSPYQVAKEKHHILKHFPKAVFIPFETSNHNVHQKFPDLFVEQVVKFIKQYEIIN